MIPGIGLRAIQCTCGKCCDSVSSLQAPRVCSLFGSQTLAQVSLLVVLGVGGMDSAGIQVRLVMCKVLTPVLSLQPNNPNLNEHLK